MTLAAVDTTSALAVSDYLNRARTWLATAVEMTGPAEIAAAKAEIATAAEATKQLNLSKEIQLDAKEMVRRAEYALGKSIRKGQAEGTVSERGYQAPSNGGKPAITRVPNLVGKNEWRGEAGIAAVAQAEPEAFDAAITEAKAEGNLSRANVARKARAASEPEAAKPAPRRRPLPDVTRDAAWELRRSVERLQRIAGDDRFDINKQQVAPLLRGHLENAVEVCQDLLARINEQGEA